MEGRDDYGPGTVGFFDSLDIASEQRTRPLQAEPEDEDDTQVEFAGAVGFFDAPQVETPKLSKKKRGGAVGSAASDGKSLRRASVVLDSLALSNKAEKLLGAAQSQKVFAHNGPLTWNDLSALMTLNPELTTVSAKNAGFRPADMFALSAVFMKFHTLRFLDLSGNPLGLHGVETLLDCCRGNVELSELRLASVGLGATSATLPASSASSSSQPDVRTSSSSSAIPSAAGEGIDSSSSSVLSTSPNSSGSGVDATLHIDDRERSILCRILDDFPSLQTVDLSDNGLSAAAIRCVAVSASEHASLTSLNLERNSISPSVASDLLRVVCGNEKLREVLLMNKDGGTRGIGRRLTLLRRTSGQEKDEVSAALGRNLSLLHLQVDGLSVGETSKVQQMLSQNQAVVERRSKIVVSGRSLLYVPPRIYNMAGITELDLSNNHIDRVPREVLQLKNLVWLSFEKNNIGPTAVPVHLVELRKIRYANFAGNPFTMEMPREVAADNWFSLVMWFKQLSAKDEAVVEARVGVLFTSLIQGEAARLSNELQKFSKRQIKSSGSGAAVRYTRGRDLSQGGLSSALVTTKKAKATLRSQSKTSISLVVSGATTGSASGKSPKNQQPTIRAIVQDCEPSQFAVLALFHKFVIVHVDMGTPDWETAVRQLLVPITGNRDNTWTVFVLVTNVGGSTVLSHSDARRRVIDAVNERFMAIGVAATLLHLQEPDFATLCEALNGRITATVSSGVVPRSFCLALSSVANRAVDTVPPLLPVNMFSNNLPLLRWAQCASLLSATIGKEWVCTSMDWASQCVGAVNVLSSSVFEQQDMRFIFQPDKFSPETRTFALKLLESASTVVQTGWLRQQWIVLCNSLKLRPDIASLTNAASLAASGASIAAIMPTGPSFGATPAGAIICKRLFRVSTSPSQVNFATVVQRIFLQAAGVLSEVTDMRDAGFWGSLVLEDIAYQVQVTVDREDQHLCVTVNLQSDSNGQVVHIVTTAIERGLEEEALPYTRVFLSPTGETVSIDRVLEELEKQKNRGALDAMMKTKWLKYLPDVALLGKERIFWEELQTVAVIGAGSFGEVKLAQFNGRQVAMKHLRHPTATGGASSGSSSLASSGSPRSAAIMTIRETLRELWALSVLHHPSIVRPVGVCLDPLAICMEYLDLGDLRKFLDNCNDHLSASIRLSLLFDIASGMEYAHSRRPPLVHSDLKSPNILLSIRDNALVAKIADLGLASFAASTLTSVNNPLWSAPETIERGVCDTRTDVYSFAIIMWEIFSGEFPFAKELRELLVPIPELRVAILGGRRPDLTFVDGSDVPAGVIPLMQACWAKDPAARPSFRQVVAQLLQIEKDVKDASVHAAADYPHRAATDADDEVVVVDSVSAPAVPLLRLCEHLSSPLASRPKTAVNLANQLVVLTEDGFLSVFDASTFSLSRKLYWRLSERVRTSYSVLYKGNAYFSFGGDTLFVLSSAFAATRVSLALVYCDILCCTSNGGALWVAGRDEQGPALQVMVDNVWESSAWRLSDTSAPILLLSAVGTEMWCVCGDKDSSTVVALASDRWHSSRMTKQLKERIQAIACVPADTKGEEPHRVWLCLASGGAMLVDRESFSIVAQLAPAVGFSYPVLVNVAFVGHAQEQLLFVFTKDGAALVTASDGQVVARATVVDEDTGRRGMVGSAIAVAGNPQVFVLCSPVGLRTWRVTDAGVVSAATAAAFVSAKQKAKDSSWKQILSPARNVSSSGKASTGSGSPSSSSNSKGSATASSAAAAAATTATTAPTLTAEKSAVAPVNSSSSSNSSFKATLTSIDASFSKMRNTNIHMTRRAGVRATVTCDDSGKIVSANAAVKNVFGHNPEALIGQSVRGLFFMPRSKERSGSVLLYSRQAPQHFTASELWQGLLQDLLAVRVVNAQCKDGSTVPLLISISSIVLEEKHVFVLLFEPLTKDCAIAVFDETGVVLSASASLHRVIGWTPDRFIGKVINSAIASPPPKTYMKNIAFDPSAKFGGTARKPNGDIVPITLQVLDFSQGAYTLMLIPGDATSAADAIEGEALNHYSLGRVLGTGMSGQVREATHKLTGEKVAVKVLRVKDFENVGIKFSDREIHLMKRLDHPGVVQLLDYVKMEQKICVVMELINGTEMFSYCLERGRLPDTECRSYIWDIVEGVEYIHARGVVHRDLKLENCMLMHDTKKVKIIDFGLGQSTLEGPLSTSCGSPNYAAPELFYSKRYQGPPVDVWAIGVIIFAMISSEFPFQDVQDTLDAYYDWPFSVATTLSDLVAAMFETDPERRLTLPQVRQHPWMLVGRPASDGNPRPAPRDDGNDIDVRAVCILESEYGMPMELVIRSLRNCEVNHFTATYKIIRKRVREDPNGKLAQSAAPSMLSQVQAVLDKMDSEDPELSLESIRARKKQGNKGLDGSSSKVNMDSSSSGVMWKRGEVPREDGTNNNNTNSNSNSNNQSNTSNPGWKRAEIK